MSLHLTATLARPVALRPYTQHPAVSLAALRVLRDQLATAPVEPLAEQVYEWFDDACLVPGVERAGLLDENPQELLWSMERDAADLQGPEPEYGEIAEPDYARGGSLREVGSEADWCAWDDACRAAVSEARSAWREQMAGLLDRVEPVLVRAVGEAVAGGWAVLS